MKDSIREDGLRNIDFCSAFPETPAAIHDAVLKAQVDIRRYQKRRIMIRNLATAVAACLVVMLSAAVFFARSNQVNNDTVTPPVLSQSDMAIDRETPVFTSRTDPYYHSTLDCDSAYEDSVEIPLITALEFEKSACPACAGELMVSREELN